MGSLMSKKEYIETAKELEAKIPELTRRIEQKKREIGECEEQLKKLKRDLRKLMEERRKAKKELERLPRRYYNQMYRLRKRNLENMGEVINTLFNGG